MALPTFVIVGAQKCGTSSLAATLRRHPQVFMAKPKEVHYFDREHTKGLDWYSDQFDPKPSHVAIGEATPVYMYDEEARRRLSETLPTAKLVVILRNPTSRAYSHFWHSRRMGFEDVESFEEALALEPERLVAERSDRIRFSYVDRGLYLEQVRALEKAQGAERVHVMLLEELLAERERELTALFGYLGVDPAYASRIEPQWTNRYREAKSPGGKPEVVKYPPMEPATRAMLVERFRASNAELAEHLGKDLAAWDA